MKTLLSTQPVSNAAPQLVLPDMAGADTEVVELVHARVVRRYAALSMQNTNAQLAAKARHDAAVAEGLKGEEKEAAGLAFARFTVSALDRTEGVAEALVSEFAELVAMGTRAKAAGIDLAVLGL
jgi:hypothetical protein